MKTKFYILIIFLIYAAPAFSASFDIVPKTSDPDYKVGDEILFEINLDTNGLSYNTVDGKVLVGNNLEIKQVITGSSIISAWIESPIDTKNNQIDFSGIIAGGFKGNGNLFQIILVPKYSGETNISTSENFVYINDGLGTEEKIEDTIHIVDVRDTYKKEQNTLVYLKDTTPPEKFEVTLIKDRKIEDGKYILVFQAIDKGSGIKTYEILEGKKLFKQATSPYVLVNQKINERIYVKAIDHDGNERTVRVYIPEKVCLGVKCFDQKIAILILICAFILSFILWRKQSKEFKEISENI